MCSSGQCINLRRKCRRSVYFRPRIFRSVTELLATVGTVGGSRRRTNISASRVTRAREHVITGCVMLHQLRSANAELRAGVGLIPTLDASAAFHFGRTLHNRAKREVRSGATYTRPGARFSHKFAGGTCFALGRTHFRRESPHRAWIARHAGVGILDLTGQAQGCRARSPLACLGQGAIRQH